jgi:acyl-CoA dehydrogenase
MSAGDLVMAICIFAIQTIKTFAKDALKERLLPELGSGKHVMSFALTEPAAGVNTPDIQTSAKLEGDGYVINGQKIWITLAHKATLMNVVARTTPKDQAPKRTGGLSLFLVEKAKLKRGQIRTEKIEDISMRALGSNEVFLDDVYIP